MGGLDLLGGRLDLDVRVICSCIIGGGHVGVLLLQEKQETSEKMKGEYGAWKFMSYLHEAVDVLLRDALLVAVLVELKSPVRENTLISNEEAFVLSKLADDLSVVCVAGRHVVSNVCKWND